jgi:hypothetical protein
LTKICLLASTILLQGRQRLIYLPYVAWWLLPVLDR